MMDFESEKIKIGTITFHWATNYGAVLQAFALQQFLDIQGYQTEIINYVPSRVKYIQILSDLKNFRFNNLLKEYKINTFRKRNLRLSNSVYHTNNSLVINCHEYDMYICGSDQIWNESFVLTSEEKPNLSYYLNFVKSDKRRISYATSFGKEKLSKEVIDLVRPELDKFSNISIRENTGKNILEDMGSAAVLVVDPTILLEKESYERIFENRNIAKKYQLFSYILHENQKTANAINDYVFNNYFNKSTDKKYNKEPINVHEWLYNIKNSRFVLTNSFHGVVFALIFNKPFIAIPVEDSKMNDRINTLLSSIGMKNRSIDKYNENTIDQLMNETIKWDEVNSKIENLRKVSIEFLEKAIRVNNIV